MRYRSNYSLSPEGATGGWRALRSLLPYLWPREAPSLRARVVLAMVMLFAARAASVYIPVFYARAVDELAPDDIGLIAVPVALILAYGAARVLSLAFNEARDAIFVNVAERAIRTIALEVFRHLHALSLRFHLGRQTGRLSQALDRGTRAISLLLRFSLFSIIPTAVELVLVFVILWNMLDAVIALTTMATVVLYIAYTLVVTEWRIKFRRRMNEEEGQASNKSIDSLLNFETVKYFGNEAHEARRLDEALQGYERAAVMNQVSLSLLNVGQAAIIAVGLTAVMLLSAWGIVAGTMTIGGFVLANTYLMQLYQPLNVFGFIYREIKQALIDIEEMFGLLDESDEIADTPEARDLVVEGGRIEFDDVAFGYDARRPILEEVSFTIPAGCTLAIVGPSGGGKSTVSRLLFRFYEVDGGAVRIDGQDVRAITKSSLRAAIGIVPQDTVLFNDTIYYNIAYGRPDATPAEVERAARLARIHDFIVSTPDGYQTVVGERGLKLSGGEKQRVSIARTVLKDPRSSSSTRRLQPSIPRPSARFSRTCGSSRAGARRSASRTDCRRSSTPTRSSSSTQGASSSGVGTTSSSRSTARTPTCGAASRRPTAAAWPPARPRTRRCSRRDGERANAATFRRPRSRGRRRVPRESSPGLLQSSRIGYEPSSSCVSGPTSAGENTHTMRMSVPASMRCGSCRSRAYIVPGRSRCAVPVARSVSTPSPSMTRLASTWFLYCMVCDEPAATVV